MVNHDNRLFQGICFNIVGPALLDIQRHQDITIEEASVIYTYRSAGYTIGCLVSGYIYNFVNRQLLSSLMLLVMGFTLHAQVYAPLTSLTDSLMNFEKVL